MSEICFGRSLFCYKFEGVLFWSVFVLLEVRRGFVLVGLCFVRSSRVFVLVGLCFVRSSKGFCFDRSLFC